MARYNTVSPTSATTTTATISVPSQGLLTEFTGTAPYTVVVPDPTIYYGNTNSFYNATSGTITIQTPSGVFKGPSSSGTNSQAISAGTTMTLGSDGVNYIIVSENGGPLVSTTGTLSSDLTVNTGNVSVTSGSLSVTSGNITFGSTGYMLVPKGTTAQRPGSPVQGHLRYNTDQNYLENYNGTSWTPAFGFRNVDVINSSYSASSWDLCWTRTGSSALTITLPASPSKGDTIRFIDLDRSFNSRNLTVSRNGQPIQGDAADLTVNTNGAAFDLIYYNSSYGWRIFSI